ncbi:DUF2726 domain-containing protein [Brachyspira murdochii]|uniref:DUF2726 domain-containing protein n=1 Tax=Brachyspira murdochii (strain ATCC 51284 / DSM 12563 / 56-150) TaxID=526224 RepID=D5U8T1_BRAM5|nr:DUF2726 domain-containing protein [Brachyspira murdochii]ADG71104.1 conserved hypothetical protein [Brachyspira murdochii DSM 12563]
MAIIGAVLFLIIILFAISKMDNRTKSCGYKKNYYRRYRKYNKYIKKDITELRLENMDTGNISTKKIMNIEETKIFFSMLKVFRDYNIYKQVSFKAFLDAEENTDVWKTFRDFYCDFLITHKKGNKINEPIAVIEYDGAGHFGNNEDIKEKIKNNDLIKEKLIQKAGMKYFIIKEKDIKINDKFIDDKKLENFLNSIIISLKSNN